jgi:putative ABC transport system substrate-binding protein
MPAEAVERRPPVLPASQIDPFKAYCTISPSSLGRLGMRRREFIALTCGTAAWPLLAHAQHGDKAWRIGYLAESRRPVDEIFRQSLRRLGYVEGSNLTMIDRWAEGGSFGPLADDLVAQNVDLIVAVTSPATRAVKERTTRIPIVMVGVGDPVAYGFIPSLAHPGGNVTGMSMQLSEIGVKGIQYMREILPRATRLVVLGNEKNPGNASMLTSVVHASSSLGFETKYHEVISGDVVGTLTTILQDQPDVLFVIPDNSLYTHRRQIIDFAMTNRIPALYGLKEYVPEGGLMAVGPSREEVFRRAAEIVDKILKGANPAEVPVEQPTRFELLINLKTARALGLTVPPSLLARADEVIE